MRHLASVLYQKSAKHGKKACKMPLLTPLLPATTPCENEIFATKGQNSSREGSQNVKKYAVYFTHR